MREDRPNCDMPAGMMNRIGQAEEARPSCEKGIGLERRIELQLLAKNIAFMVRGQANRRERCVLSGMVETLLSDEQ